MGQEKRSRPLTDTEKALGVKRDYVSEAKILCLYHYFEMWEMEGRSWIDVGKDIASSCCMIPKNHWRNLRKYEDHNEKRRRLQESKDGF